MVIVVIVLIVLLAIAVVLTPWRAGEDRSGEAEQERESMAAARVLELATARDAKYREIRDAELDRDTGHLSAEDFAAIDRTLRSEAVDILRRLDDAEARLLRLRRQREDVAPAAETREDEGAVSVPAGVREELPSSRDDLRS